MGEALSIRRGPLSGGRAKAAVEKDLLAEGASGEMATFILGEARREVSSGRRGLGDG